MIGPFKHSNATAANQTLAALTWQRNSIMATKSGRRQSVVERFCCSNRACSQWIRTYNPLRRLLVYLAIVVLYVLLGAWVFSAVESPSENERILAAKEELETLKRALSILVHHNQTALGELTRLVEDICSLGAFKDQPKLWEYTPSVLFTTTVVTTIGTLNMQKHPYNHYLPTVAIAIAYYIVTCTAKLVLSYSQPWSPVPMLRSDPWPFLLCTCVGYGTIAPSTAIGQGLVIPYTLVGIPLNLLFLITVGKWLSLAYRKVQRSVSENQIMSILSYLILLLLGWCIFAVLPALVLSYAEGWSYGESLYFAVVTLTTVGFGDYVPAMQTTYSPSARMAYDVCFSIWLFVGMAYISLLLIQIGDFFTAVEDKIAQLFPFCLRFEDTFGKYARLPTLENYDDDGSNDVQETTCKDEGTAGSPKTPKCPENSVSVTTLEVSQVRTTSPCTLICSL